MRRPAAVWPHPGPMTSPVIIPIGDATSAAFLIATLSVNATIFVNKKANKIQIYVMGAIICIYGYLTFWPSYDSLIWRCMYMISRGADRGWMPPCLVSGGPRCLLPPPPPSDSLRRSDAMPSAQKLPPAPPRLIYPHCSSLHS